MTWEVPDTLRRVLIEKSIITVHFIWHGLQNVFISPDFHYSETWQFQEIAAEEL